MGNGMRVYFYRQSASPSPPPLCPAKPLNIKKIAQGYSGDAIALILAQEEGRGVNKTRIGVPQLFFSFVTLFKRAWLNNQKNEEKVNPLLWCAYDLLLWREWKKKNLLLRSPPPLSTDLLLKPELGCGDEREREIFPALGA